MDNAPGEPVEPVVGKPLVDVLDAGMAAGVAVTVAEAAPAPTPFTARSWKLYAVPLARPVTRCSTVAASLPAMSVQPGFQVVPPSALRRYCHPVTAESLSAPAVHARTAAPAPSPFTARS